MKLAQGEAGGLSPYVLFLLVLLVAFGQGATSVRSSSTLEPYQSVYQASTKNLTYLGIAPTSISLYWTPSSDPSFVEYILQESKASAIGPFETVSNIYQQSTTSYYASGQVPAGTEWWQIYYQNQTGFEVSNVLQVTQPDSSILSYSMEGSTNLTMTWDNKAAYGGLVSFDSYQIFRSVAGGAYAVIAGVTNANTLNYQVIDLTPSTNYSFYVNTTDKCYSCSTPLFSSSASNTVTLRTQGPLTVSAASISGFVDVGQPVSFSCTAIGGTPPYSFSWSFGDRSTGVDPATTHIYTESGTMNAICTVTDVLGVRASYPTSVSVSPDPSISTLTVQPSFVTAGESVTITASVTGGYGEYTYSWTNLPPGCMGGNHPSITCSPSSTGNYQVKVTVTDAAGETTARTMTLPVEPENAAYGPSYTGLAVTLSALGTAAFITIIVAIQLFPSKDTRAQAPAEILENRGLITKRDE